nr:protein Daple-like [Ipomoea batatas]
MDSSSMDALDSYMVGDAINGRHRQLRSAYDVLQLKHHDLHEDYARLKQEHEALRERHGKQEIAHATALEAIIQCQSMVDAMVGWQEAQDYRGRVAMGPLAEDWLQEIEEGKARIVREGEVTFYMGQRQTQDFLYAKLRRHFSTFNIFGWKLPETLPL